MTPTLKTRTPSGLKTQQLSERLHVLAQEKGPGYKLPSVRELCTLLSTNPTTLTSVLNDLETRNVIYRKDRSGIFVSPHVHRRTITVLLDTAFFQSPGVSPYWGQLWGACAEEAQRRTKARNELYQFQLVQSGFGDDDKTLSRAIKDLEAGRLHGAIAIGLQAGDQDWEALRPLPLVTYAGAGHWGVSVDTSAEDQAAAVGLAAKGCKRVANWAPANFERFMPRYGGSIAVGEFAFAASSRTYTQNLFAAAGLTWHEDLVFDTLRLAETYQNDPSCYETLRRMTYQDQGNSLAWEQFSRPRSEWPDGLFIGDDMITLGALAVFSELGVRVGQDVHICSHSNAESIVLHGWEHRIARVETNPKEVARMLFATLDRLMDGEEPEQRFSIVPSHYYPV